jgi:hypothetical protein
VWAGCWRSANRPTMATLGVPGIHLAGGRPEGWLGSAWPWAHHGPTGFGTRRSTRSSPVPSGTPAIPESRLSDPCSERATVVPRGTPAVVATRTCPVQGLSGFHVEQTAGLRGGATAPLTRSCRHLGPRVSRGTAGGGFASTLLGARPRQVALFDVDSHGRLLLVAWVASSRRTPVGCVPRGTRAIQRRAQHPVVHPLCWRSPGRPERRAPDV